MRLSQETVEGFHRDGFVVVDGLIGDDTTDRLRDAFERIFSGRFETGIRPDEVNYESAQLASVTKGGQILEAVVAGVAGELQELLDDGR